jgi:ATP-dependent phosphoenolpyruvate carboxykinase
VQNLPKSISDKVQFQIDNANRKGNGLGKLQGKHLQGDADKDKEIVTNTNKNQNHWWVKENKNFSKVFYKNQKQCPKTEEGNFICKKFFLHSFCEKSCTHAHNLSKEEEKKFNRFVTKCRERASKPDF